MLNGIYQARNLVFPILAVILLSIAIQATQAQLKQSWLIIIAQGLTVIFLLRTAVMRFIENGFIRSLFLWVGIPVATLHIFGWLDHTVAFLDSIALEAGDIRLSAYSLARVAIFGSILFWLGKNQTKLDRKRLEAEKHWTSEARKYFLSFLKLPYSYLSFSYCCKLWASASPR